MTTAKVRNITTAASVSRPKRKLNWWLAQVMDAYYAARELWLAEREAYANGYATEEAMFAEMYPRPLLKDFLKAYSHKAQREIAMAA